MVINALAFPFAFSGKYMCAWFSGDTWRF